MIQVPEWAMVMAFYALYPLSITVILGAIGFIAEDLLAIKASWTTRALSVSGKVFRAAKITLAVYFALSAPAFVFVAKTIFAWSF